MSRIRPVLATVVALGALGALPPLDVAGARTAPAAVTVAPVVARLAVAQPAGGLAPGTPLHVTGTLNRQDPRTAAVGHALPASYRLRVHNEDASIDHTYGPFQTRTGDVDVTLPAAATADVSPTEDEQYREVLAVTAVDVRAAGLSAPTAAGAAAATVAKPPAGLRVDTLWSSHVGWVKPGETYPMRVLVRNYAGTKRAGVTVTLRGVPGMVLRKARSGSTNVAIRSNALTWRVGTVAGGTATRPAVKALVIEARARTLREDPRVSWKNLSLTATLRYGGTRSSATSHGPKVIPPDGFYDTARYGDRPFPVVPIDYTDRKHRPENAAAKVSRVINDPKYKGSTFALYQEMSLGQLFPHATVPSAGIATRDVKPTDGLHFSVPAPTGTCRGASQVSPVDGAPLPTYTQRVNDGWYQLPGTTDYYGDDKYGSALAGALGGVGPLFSIDDACGPTAKAAFDAAVVADPDIDYSDYDSDKDGVVDFFEVIFVGLGGHGVSQLGCTGDINDPDQCGLAEDPPTPYYDNIWPHSSSLEFSYTDPATGQGGYVSKDQLKDHEGRPLFYTDKTRGQMTTRRTAYKVFVRVGPYNVNPETALAKASVISHEYGHSLGLPDFYSTGSRETYGDWNLMATDKSQNMDIFSKQELGWIVPREVPKGSTKVLNWRDSKVDTHQIVWHTPSGQRYTLSGSTVHNALAYTVKLPQRRVISPTKLRDASPTHTWWSGSGNSFGCAPAGAHNLDVYLPELKNVPAGTTVTASFKSLWDMEWDYDYGFVLTGKPDSNGKVSSYTSHASSNGYTTPGPVNPNGVSCQTTYGNGLTGSSGSYRDRSDTPDRAAGTYPDPTFLADSYDISDLAGTGGVLRFSYSTDPGVARPGWFIDDLTITAGSKVIYKSNFEKTGSPEDPRLFNGGCARDTTVAAQCTDGWQWLDASEGLGFDHGYYLEMRDRSGYDYDGKGQNDRDSIKFQPGLLLVYTDEAHGYGNTGASDPPPQSPLDANPAKPTTDS
ncbi:MAG: immune inhibitor A domain-containing protein, partial [Mycobacteriales bacterium]